MNIETVDLNISDNEPISLDKPSVNFGPGIELLMNDKKKNSSRANSPSSDINLADLQDLEDDLNNLSADKSDDTKYTLRESKSSAFSAALNSKPSSGDNDFDNQSLQSVHSINLNIDDDIKTVDTPSVKFTNDIKKNSDEKTWDGFQKFNDIPVDPQQNFDNSPKMSREEALKEKFEILKKLEVLEKRGVELSKKYTMESSLMEMQGEYETIISNKERDNSVKFQGKMLMACITGLEF